MNEIGGTFKWSKKQIVAYAGAFNEGDAINVDGVGWVEVTSRKDAHGDFLEAGELNGFKLSMNGVGVHRGFIWPKSRYLVTTPKDYEVKEGDKLVWLGETQKQGARSEYTFGKSYDIERQGDRLVYKDDMTLSTSILARSEKDRWKLWGVIPRYENVKEEEEMNERTELVDEVEYSGKFKVGDRVKVTGGSHKGYKGVVTQLGERVSMIPSHVVLLDEGRGSRWFAESLLELVEEGEKSAEQEAFEYLLTLDRTAIKNFVVSEIDDWAKEFLEQKDYDSAKQAIEILKKMEETK